MTEITLTGHGAVSDAQMIEDGAMTSGQPALTSPAGLFTSADVGKAIVVGGAGAGGAKLRTTVSAYVSTTELTLTDNAQTTITSGGAAWGTDCSAALAAALSEADAQRGGTILVDGTFLLAEPVSRAFFATVTTSYVRILGTGSDSTLIIALDSTETALNLESLTVDVERISFVGIPDAGADAKHVLRFDGCTASLRRCKLIGLATADQPVHFAACWATLEGNAFGGTFIITGGSPGAARSVVYSDDWYSFEDHASQFIDYGYWRGLLLSKSGLGGTSAWVGIATPNGSHVDSGARVAGIASLRGTRLDEGSLRGVWAQPASGTIAAVELVGTAHNVSPVAGSSGVYGKSVETMLVDRCTFGLSADPQTAFGRFENCGRVEVDSATLLQGVDKIVASNVEALIVRDTEIDHYDLTSTGFFPQSSKTGGLALVKAGAIGDSDFPEAPGPGTLALDRTNGRLYVRATGDWIYFTMDGGSLLGPELVTNGTFAGGTTTGWTASNATLSVVSGKLRVTNLASGGRALASFPVEIGKSYRFSVEINSGAGVVRLGTSPSGGQYFETVVVGATTTFVATSTTAHIALICAADPVGYFAEFDNISIRAT